MRQKTKKFLASDSEEEHVEDEDLLSDCYQLGLDDKALPSTVLDQLTPPKFSLSLVEVDYIKLMQKALYFFKVEAKEKKKQEKLNTSKKTLPIDCPGT